MRRLLCFVICMLLLLLPGLVSAQTFTELYSFGPFQPTGTSPNGGFPAANSVTTGPGGVLYGTSPLGGSDKLGTIFTLTTTGTLTVIYNSTDGQLTSPLVLASDGNFYGVTSWPGTVYRITPSGQYSTIATFGNVQLNGLVAWDAALYGTSTDSVFSVSLAGKVSVIQTLSSEPLAAPTVGPDGNLYGTTSYDFGTGQPGMVYEITPSGTYSVVGSLGNVVVQAGLTAANSKLYGVTYNGGANQDGSIFTVANGEITTIYSFGSTGGSTGQYPYATLTVGGDGNLYGTTVNGGAYSVGTVFELCGESVSVTHSFNGFDGTYPKTQLTALGNTLYGEAYEGGTFGCGDVYTITLAPVVPIITGFSPTTAPAGAVVTVTGAGFTSVTATSFDGVPCSFKVISDTDILLTVPTKAITGPLHIRDAAGLGVSSGVFTAQ